LKPAFHTFERQTLVAPLGLRFHDAATGRSVEGGLEVNVYTQGRWARALRAFPNLSGTYVLHHAPGLEEFERSAGDREAWLDAPPPRPFTVEVRDTERRFLPCRFEVELPTRGIYRWSVEPESSPLTEGEASVPLYSAPSRAVVPGLAAIRLELKEAETGLAAAWALIDAYIDAVTPTVHARGIADEQGRVLVVFPVPEPAPYAQSSPPDSPPQPPYGSQFSAQQWPVRIEAAYVARHPAPDVPDLREILTQPGATLWGEWTDPTHNTPLAEQSLRYGSELVVRTHDSANDSQLSELLITPAGSPPY
jgi:hypothetical protein